MSLTFSINQYDSDGDSFDNCILIHSKDDNFILRFENILELRKFKKQLIVCIEQIEEETK